MWNQIIIHSDGEFCVGNEREILEDTLMDLQGFVVGYEREFSKTLNAICQKNFIRH